MPTLPPSRRPLARLGLSALVAGLAACAHPAAPGPALAGTVRFPAPYGLAATSAELSAYASVSLHDAAGVVQAAGTSDAAGHFAIYDARSSFAASPGAFYTLNAVKRYQGGGENRLLALRTLVKREGAGWRSISGSSVRVDLATTTVLKLLELDPALTEAQLLDTVDPASGAIAAIGGHPAPELARLKDSIGAFLASNGDPTGVIGEGRTISLTDQASIDQAQGYQVVDHLIVQVGNGIQTVELPNLERVEGLLVFTTANSNLVRFKCPKLSHAGFLNIYQAPALAAFDDLPALQSVYGLRVVDRPESAAPLDLSRFAGVVFSTPPATAADTPGLLLSNVRGVSLGAAPWAVTELVNLQIDNTPFTSLSALSGLTRVSSNFAIDNNDALVTLGLDALVQAGGAGGAREMRNNPLLECPATPPAWFADVDRGGWCP